MRRRVELGGAAAGPIRDVPAVARDGIDGALISREPRGLFIGTGPSLASAASVELHRRGERRGRAVVPVEEEGAFVCVAVAAEHEIDPARFQDRQDVRADLDELRLRVGIMRALRVRRVMPEGDDPVLRRGLKIGLEPCEHCAPRRAARRHRIQADEVNPAVIERVVFLRARGDAARLAVGWIVEDLEVRNRQRRIRGARGVVVADRGPEHRLAQVAGIHVEDGSLVFRVGAVVVGIVAEHQPHVGVAARGEARVAVAHRCGDGVLCPRIPEHPDAGGLRGADRGRGEKGIVRAGRERGGGGADRVEILRIGREAGERDLVLGGDGRVIHVRGELAGGRPAADAAVRRGVRAPAHDEARRRPLLQIRPAGDDRRAGLLEAGDPQRAIRERAVDRASGAVTRDGAAAFVQSPPPDQPCRRRDLRVLVRGDVGGGPGVIPDAHLIEHAAEEPGRDTRRVQGRPQRRVLDAVRARWPVDDQFRLKISIEEELPLCPVVSRRCVIPDAVHDRRDADDRMIEPR